MFQFLFNIFIQPIIYLYELVFYVSYNIFCKYIFHNTIFTADCLPSIFVLSLFVNIVTLPLYNSANFLQDEERKIQNIMKNTIGHINKTFNGDERFFMINAYYNEKNYKPIYALRSSISLLLQIPFFTAAYCFFTNIGILNKMSPVLLSFINDYSKSDSFIIINGFSINILPIIMTIVNLISCFMYTYKFSFKEKIQPLLLALLFLVILYNSPSALVIYWLFNNIFSLIKIIYNRFHTTKKLNYKFLLNKSFSDQIIIILLFNIIIFCGVFIPIQVISSSPLEFYNFNRLPIQIIIYTITIFIGYSFWIYIYYRILYNKKMLIFFINTLILIFIFNHLLFGNNFGLMSSRLVYENGYRVYNNSQSVFNLFIIFLVALISWLFIHSKTVSKCFLVTVLISTSLFSLINLYKICSVKYIPASNITQSNTKKLYNLSKNGKNLIYIMLDRSCGAYFPYILAQRPDLIKMYSGFNYYSNCISFGGNTITGSPEVFGSNFYTPYEMSIRKDRLLLDKHNDALRFMPLNFDICGYNVYVSNLPYENYCKNNNNIFNDLPSIKNIDIIGNSNFKEFLSNTNNAINNLYIQNRCFIMYTFMEILPRGIRGVIYNDGNYLFNEFHSFSEFFIKNYAGIRNLTSVTNIVDDSSNNALFYCNEITHNNTKELFPRNVYEPIIDIENPNYNYSDIVDFDGKRFNGNSEHLSTETVTYVLLADFFQYLKDNNVYDNTRIIIISDHGATYGSEMEKELTFVYNDNNTICPVRYNPILLYKDFNSKGDLIENKQLMSNADGPILAMQNIIPHPIDPYYKAELDMSHIHNNLVIMESGYKLEELYDKSKFYNFVAIFNGDNIFKKESWSINTSKFENNKDYLSSK